MENKGNRMRRLLAFLIDLILFYLPCVLSTAILQPPFLGNAAILIILIAVITFFVTFILRDYLFNGHSIGKRIFKLRVVDADTRSEPTAKQLIVKNLFLFLYIFDGIFCLLREEAWEKELRTLLFCVNNSFLALILFQTLYNLLPKRKKQLLKSV